MKFIRENLFLVVLVAVVLAIGGVLLAVDFSLAGDVQKQIGSRQIISSSFRTLSTTAVNQTMVDLQKERVAKVLDDANKLAREETQRNHQRYEVLQLHKDANQLVPAFPYDASEYSTWGLLLKFCSELQREVDKLRTDVGSVRATQKDIDADVAAETKRQETPVRRFLLESGDPNKAATQTEITAMASAWAREKVTKDYSLKGSLYIDEEILADLAIDSNQVNLTDKTLWEKQFQLWIARDVLTSIKAANDDVLGKLPEGSRTVEAAPVKRLSKLHISDTYHVREGASAAATAAPGAAPAPAPAPAPTPTPAAGDVTEEISLTSGDLSQRGTDKDVEVVHYSFSVIMPSSQVPLLMRKLEELKHHTVLETRIREAQVDTKARYYYYGKEAMAEVSILGEVLFFTAWERDLMPKSFLQTLPPSARRPQDALKK